jgi:hypothetical protein
MLEPRFEVHPEHLPEGCEKSLDGFRHVLANGGTAPWKGLPGLRNKYFTLYGDSMGAGFYTWTNKHDLEEYMESELWEGMS